MAILDEYILMAVSDEVEEPCELVLKEIEEEKIPKVKELYLALLTEVYHCEFELSEMEDIEEDSDEDEEDGDE